MLNQVSQAYTVTRIFVSKCNFSYFFSLPVSLPPLPASLPSFSLPVSVPRSLPCVSFRTYIFLLALYKTHSRPRPRCLSGVALLYGKGERRREKVWYKAIPSLPSPLLPSLLASFVSYFFLSLPPCVPTPSLFSPPWSSFPISFPCFLIIFHFLLMHFLSLFLSGVICSCMLPTSLILPVFPSHLFLVSLSRLLSSANVPV